MTGRTFVIFCATSAMLLLSATAVGQFVHTNDTPQIPHLSSIPENIGVPPALEQRDRGVDGW